MQSEIMKELGLKYAPVAVLFCDERPQGALEFASGTWGCVGAMLTAAARGQRAVFSRSTFGCRGGGVGLGLTDKCPEGMEYRLSTGKEGIPSGQALKKTPALAKELIASLPFANIRERYVVFAPLSEVDVAQDEPKVVVFYVNPDQLSALVLLANFGRPGYDSVVAPSVAGCQTVCLLPLGETGKKYPRAFIGMTDVKARAFIDADLLSFSVPYALFREMEDNIPGSFLEQQDWKNIRGRMHPNNQE